MTKEIEGYENYLIDEEGNIYNTNTNKYLKGFEKDGYKYCGLFANKSKRNYLVHRLVAQAFIPNPDNLPYVNHIDGNKLNNNANNLEWVTQSQNIQHAHDNNLIKKQGKKEYYKEDLDGEEWKKMLNTDYSVSSCGRIRNDTSNVLLKSCHKGLAYNQVSLFINGVRKNAYVHVLVYKVFHDMEELPEKYVIDHIDGDKRNNNLNNLRLLTNSENIKAAFYETKTNKNCKTVRQYDKEGNFIQEFPSIRKAADTLFLDQANISSVCRGGKHKTCGGFIFRYADD